MTEKEKMIAGDLYRAGDPALVADRKRAQALMRDYNSSIYGEGETRQNLLNELLGAGAGQVALRAPLYVDYGYNIFLEPGVFMNFGCVLLDVCPIRIGADTQIGPNVQILTADHPRDPEARRQGLEMGKPITIGSNVWIGGGAILLPGITVGDDAVIGAGSVVTKDVPAGATVVGAAAQILE